MRWGVVGEKRDTHKFSERQAESSSSNCAHINAALQKSSQPGSSQGQQRLPGPWLNVLANDYRGHPPLLFLSASDPLSPWSSSLPPHLMPVAQSHGWSLTVQVFAIAVIGQQGKWAESMNFEQGAQHRRMWWCNKTEVLTQFPPP